MQYGLKVAEKEEFELKKLDTGSFVHAVVDEFLKTVNIDEVTDEEIDKAVKDAEAHAKEDKKKKEEIEARNNAESLVYNCQKTIDELGDKISGEEKAKAEAEIEKVNKALEGKDAEEIKKATDSLTQVFYSISEKLYAQTAQKPEEGNTEGTNNTAATEAESEEK